MIDIEAIRARQEESKRHFAEHATERHTEAEGSCWADLPCWHWGWATVDIDALLAEVERLRTCVGHICEVAERTMPHAIGQGHLALMSIKSRLQQTLDGTYDTSIP